MGRIQHTLELAKTSWRVLQADRELLLLPVLSGIASLFVAATFAVPLIAGGLLTAEDGGRAGGYVVMFLMYVALAVVTIFFNAALVSAANERLNGGDPTLGSALRGAVSHMGSVIVWAIISATVSVVLRAVEERGGLGRVVSAIAGLAWSLTTYLVIPVIVIEGGSPVDAVKRSAALFKQTWGQQVAGTFGFGILGFIAAIPAIALVVLAISIGSAGLIGAAIGIAVLWMITVSIVLSALGVVFQTALYRHAAGVAHPGGPFSPHALQGAFR